MQYIHVSKDGKWFNVFIDEKGSASVVVLRNEIRSVHCNKGTDYKSTVELLGGKKFFLDDEAAAELQEILMASND